MDPDRNIWGSRLTVTSGTCGTGLMADKIRQNSVTHTGVTGLLNPDIGAIVYRNKASEPHIY